MNFVLAIIGVTIVLILVLLNTKLFDKKDKRKHYLQQLADFLEAPLQQIAGQENSFQIPFIYKEREFTFEDIEDRLQRFPIYKVYLKGKTASKIKISFTERPRTTIRANVQTLSDMKSPWAADADKVILPSKLQEFTVFTNDPKTANGLFAYDHIVDIFAHFKNMTAVGHPSMSLEILDGIVMLSFHPPGKLKPSREDLEQTPSLIEDYTEQLMVIMAAIEAMEEKKK